MMKMRSQNVRIFYWFSNLVVYMKCDLAFDDAGEEFSSVHNVKKRFMNWKSSFPEEFEKTFCHLTLPQVFDIFVRKSLVSFDFEEVWCLIREL